MNNKKLTLKYIAHHVNGTVVGNSDRVVTALAPIQSAGKSDITFHASGQYNDLLAECQACVILHEKALPLCHSDAIVCENPYLAYAKVAQIFKHEVGKQSGIAKTAVIHPSAVIGSDCYIGENVVVGENARIGKGCVILAGCCIGDHCEIGDYCQFMANVTLYHHCILKHHVLVHSGTVIGSDGFGHAQDQDNRWIAIPQLGRVFIHDHVEIGANCTIDRGSLTDTIIYEGVVIDNLVQIAHNVIIGKNTAIAACVGISGSVEIGQCCRIAGQVGIAGHLRIADDVTLLAKSRNRLQNLAYIHLSLAVRRGVCGIKIQCVCVTLIVLSNDY